MRQSVRDAHTGVPQNGHVVLKSSSIDNCHAQMDGGAISASLGSHIELDDVVVRSLFVHVCVVQADKLCVPPRFITRLLSEMEAVLRHHLSQLYKRTTHE